VPTGVRTKLSPDQVQEIKRLLDAGTHASAIMKRFKLASRTVSKIRHGKLFPDTAPLAPASPALALAPAESVSSPKKPGRGKFTHLVPEMERLRASGVTWHKIDIQLGMARGQAWQYLHTRGRNRNQANSVSLKGASTNGHEQQLDPRFLVGFGCAELERTLTSIAQRLGIAPNLLRQGFSKFLGSSSLR
jgi:hypothetical protein